MSVLARDMLYFMIWKLDTCKTSLRFRLEKYTNRILIHYLGRVEKVLSNFK